MDPCSENFRNYNIMCHWSFTAHDNAIGLAYLLIMSMLIIIITDGVPSPPTNTMATVTTATLIALAWEYPGGPEIDSFEINYIYIINECTMRSPPVSISISNSSQRSYTIVNGPSTPVEEDSEYSIALTSINSVGRSSSVNVRITTPETGIMVYKLYNHGTCVWFTS